MTRSTADLEAIEAVYQRSAFVAEICVVERPSTTADQPSQFQALVFPDLARIRQRRIVNVGDLLRFELEGQGIDLPADRRVSGYQVSFTPLRRTTDCRLDRALIAEQLLARATTRGLTGVDRSQSQLPALLDAVANGSTDLSFPARANLEIDLGIDSLGRAELFATLERRTGVRLSDDERSGIFTVGELAAGFDREAVATPHSSAEQRIERIDDASGNLTTDDAAHDCWQALLDGSASEPRPELSALLRFRAPSVATLHVLLRALRHSVTNLRVSGLEHLPTRGAYLLCPNHQSYLDPVFICSTLPYAIGSRLVVLGATEYFESAVTARLARWLNLLPVDPDAHLVAAMQAAAFALRHERVVLLFPEGERSIDGTVKPFKKGAAILARRLRVPVVPVAVRGAFEVWPRNRPPHWRGALQRAHHVRVVFGVPLSLAQHASDEQATHVLHKTVSDLWNGAI